MNRLQPLLQATRQLPWRQTTRIAKARCIQCRRNGSLSRSVTSSALPVKPLTSPSSSSLFADPSAGEKPFYLTTPIFYVNASPHVGHLHTLVLSDVIARFAALRIPTRPVIFSTGTDEHGLKIQQAAKNAGVEERVFCDGVSQRFRDLAQAANISHTVFVRTSEKRHYRAVEHFWSKLVASGDIYKGTHSGWYSISDECFFAATQVAQVEGKMVAPETGNEVVWEEEENWKFRLGKYKDGLREWLQRPESVWPNSHRQSLLKQLDSLEDLSISRPRSRVRWGVPVPGDTEQTIYVWVDALINYITVLGYPEEVVGWPADIQVVGKDIIKFHALHWPALLMSANLAPPKRILAHAHWTMGKSKMSKSRGNVVNPVEAMEKWGVDGVRWYLMRVGGSLGADADYSEEELAVHYRILADQIGNLLSRISSPKILSKMGTFKAEDREVEFDKQLSGLRDKFEEQMEAYGISRACEGVMDVVGMANRLFTTLKPWSSPNPTKAVFYAYHTLRLSAILLQPVIPSKAAELLDRLGISDEHRRWEDAVWAEQGDVDTGHIAEGLKGGKRRGHLFPQVIEKDDM